MLIQLTVENFRSFRDATTLSFRAVDGVKHPPGQVVEVPGVGPVLRTAAFYGSNASGKSNLLKAVEWVRRLAEKGVAVGESIPDVGFKLPQQVRRPTRVELQFVDDTGQVWAYGLTVSDGLVLSEWLERLVEGEFHSVFERAPGPNGLAQVLWGDSGIVPPARQGFFAFVGEGTRPEQPLLAELRARNAVELTELFRWSDISGLDVPIWSLEFADEEAAEWEAFLVALPAVRLWAHEALAAADTAIRAIVPNFASQVLLDAWEGRREIGIREAHAELKRLGNELLFETAGGTLRWQDLSDGTLRLIERGVALADPVGGVTTIDELESSLHPAVARWCVEHFQGERDKGQIPFSQLLFSTHATELLDVELLGRDGIYFVDKGRDGASKVYALSEFKAEQLDELERNLPQAYRQGRFDAHPSRLVRDK